jgi:Uma2 family endonuclease
MVRKTDDNPALIEGGLPSEIESLLANQGHLDEAEYLRLTQSVNWLVEFTDGYIELLAMPTMTHQLIVQFFFQRLWSYVSARDVGEVVFAPLRVRLRPGKIREPDIIFMLKENAQRAGEEVWESADLVIEVVSRDDKSRRRDLTEKRQDYAQAGIPEYWIVDPQVEQVTVLGLAGKSYKLHGQWTGKEIAASALLQGFEVQVDQVFAAARKPR